MRCYFVPDKALYVSFTGVTLFVFLNADVFAGNNKPNVVIIYTDDMGVGDVSFLNDGWVQTPNIDKLAAQGTVITNYYTAAAVSSPSRAGLTTGIFPLNLGINTFLHTVEHNINCEQEDFLDPKFPSMARVFQSQGYATAHIGT